jgi:hypothetical protein
MRGVKGTEGVFERFMFADLRMNRFIPAHIFSITSTSTPSCSSCAKSSASAQTLSPEVIAALVTGDPTSSVAVDERMNRPTSPRKEGWLSGF